VRVRLRRDASDGIRRPALNVRRGTLRRGCQLTLAAGCLLASLAARAQLGATVAVESDYRFRGVSLDPSGPSLRAAFNYDAPNGCYGGASATQVELEHGDRYAQVLGYAGCATPIDLDRQVEGGATFSHFTGDSRYDFAEVYVGLLAGRWGARVHFAPDYFGRHVSTLYAEFNVHTELDENFRLFGHLGVITRISGDGHGQSRARGDLRVGAGWVWRGLDLQLSWVGATDGGPYPAVYGGRHGAWVAGASYSF